MTNGAEEVPIQGRSPTEESTFYVQWARESLKANIALANDILKQLVTLNAALLGGTTVLLEKAALPEGMRSGATCAFLFGLISSFLGIMPYEGRVTLTVPSEIRTHKERALQVKRRYLWAAGVCMAIGFGCIITPSLLSLAAICKRLLYQ